MVRNDSVYATSVFKRVLSVFSSMVSDEPSPSLFLDRDGRQICLLLPFCGSGHEEQYSPNFA